jgi:hypothetical protein
MSYRFSFDITECHFVRHGTGQMFPLLVCFISYRSTVYESFLNFHFILLFHPIRY